MRAATALVLALAWGQGAMAQGAPEVALRPEMRMIEPSARPVPRPATSAEAVAAPPADMVPPGEGAPGTVAPEGAPFRVAAQEVEVAEFPLVPPRARALPLVFATERGAVWDRRWSPPRHEVTIEALTAVSPETGALAAMAARAMVPPPPARPEPRPGTVTPVTLSQGGVGTRPVPRPDRELPPPPMLDADAPFPVGQDAAPDRRPQFTDAAVDEAPRPEDRPEGIEVAAAEAEVARVRGSVCGDVGIQGVVRGEVAGAGACGIADAVEVRSVAGVRLSSPAVIDCPTASALRRWVEDVAVPAVGQTGGGLAGLQIIGGYSCRSRNNVPGARLSEHSFGRALDIGGLNLRDGNTVTVLNGWDSAARGAMLRAMHRGACGIFGTVLGPDLNAAHRDHFHFDTAVRRAQAYCR